MSPRYTEYVYIRCPLHIVRRKECSSSEAGKTCQQRSPGTDDGEIVGYPSVVLHALQLLLSDSRLGSLYVDFKKQEKKEWTCPRTHTTSDHKHQLLANYQSKMAVEVVGHLLAAASIYPARYDTFTLRPSLLWLEGL